MGARDMAGWAVNRWTGWAALAGSLATSFAACAPLPAPAPSATPPARTMSPTAAPAVASAPPPVAEPSPAARQAVVCESAPAAAIADELLTEGASAADAAVAALLAAGVAQPASSGLGGAGLGLYWDAATQQATVVDFLATAPVDLEPKDYLRRPVPRAERGALVGVPGELAGLSRIHDRWGTLPWGEVVRPAMELAEKGFSLSAHMHRALRWRRDWVTSSPLRAVFAPTGELLTRGDRVRRPALGGTLRRLATGGAEPFYRGPVAERMVEAATAAGSRLALEDFEGYAPVERSPLTTTWQGHRVIVPPPPSAAGLVVLETLSMHEPATLRKLGYGSGAYLHLLAETFRGAHADRIRTLGDPDFVTVDVSALASPERMAARRGDIALDRTRAPEAFDLDEGGTSNVIAVDRRGNVAIVTSSLNRLFGARIHADGGVVLNDHLAAFDHARVWRRYGGHRRANAPRAGARPVTSMSPTLVVRDGRPVLALAASGGTQMPTAVTQGLVGHLAFGLGASRLTGDLRVDAPPTGGLRVDPRADESLLADLRGRGEVVDAQRPLYGALSVVVWRQAEGDLEAAFDPRKGGAALSR